MTRAWFFLFFLIISGCTRNIIIDRSGVQRDAESYAIASCLFYQNQAYLKDQGGAWAGAVVQRTQLDVDVLAGIAEAVRQESAKGDMAVGRSESGDERDKTLPILYCGEITSRSSIRAEVEKAVSVPE